MSLPIITPVALKDFVKDIQHEERLDSFLKRLERENPLAIKAMDKIIGLLETNPTKEGAVGLGMVLIFRLLAIQAGLDRQAGATRIQKFTCGMPCGFRPEEEIRNASD